MTINEYCILMDCIKPRHLNYWYCADHFQHFIIKHKSVPVSDLVVNEGVLKLHQKIKNMLYGFELIENATTHPSKDAAKNANQIAKNYLRTFS